jgi:Fe-S-cluster-containing hydrogenase component 2
MNEQIVWVDAVRCTGCGACIDVCPVRAMALIDGKARVDEQTCTGCGICMDACPEAAIRPVIQGELIPAPQRPAPTVYRPSPLVETAGAAMVATGVGLLVQAARALVQTVGRWLTQRAVPTGSSARGISSADGRGGGGRRGRRARHRRRGG